MAHKVDHDLTRSSIPLFHPISDLSHHTPLSPFSVTYTHIRPSDWNILPHSQYLGYHTSFRYPHYFFRGFL